MKTAIDRAGRLVVPRALRDELGLKPGRKLDIRAHDGALVIEPPPTEVKLARRGRRMVAVSTVRFPALTQDEVRAALVGARRRTLARLATKPALAGAVLLQVIGDPSLAEERSPRCVRMAEPDAALALVARIDDHAGAFDAEWLDAPAQW